MRKLLLSAVALFAMSAQNAFAINLTFQFDVNSSGPSIYACNAGIKHAKSANVCYDNVTAKTCSAGCAAGNLAACTAESSSPASCICTGELGNGTFNGTDGTWRLDYLNANTSAWTDNQTAMGDIVSHQIAANGTSDYAQLFPSTVAGQPSVEAYRNQLKDLSINLGSEVYNAQYFVDICYRGPQIDYRNDAGTTVSGLNFGLKARSTVINIKDKDENPTDYALHAGLKVKATAKCIMDDNFNYCSAGSLPGVDIGCGQPAGSYYSYNVVNDADGNDADGFVPVAQVSTTAKLIEEATMKAKGHVTPRFCQIRYEFKETNMTKMRKWKLQQARICTYTEISEPKTK